jgi:LysM repeat protein
MTRETKIGLLVGLAFIIVIGILLSDHLTSTTEPPQAPLVQAGKDVRSGVTVPGGTAAPITQVQVPQQVAPTGPVATREELQPKQPPVTVVHIGPAPSNPNTTQQPAPQKPEAVATNLPGNTTFDSNPVPTPNPAGNSTLEGVANTLKEPVVPAGAPNNTTTTTNNQPKPTPVATASGKQYKAESGDSLSKMASRFLGSNTKANRELIINANPSLKANPDMIIVGKTYTIPAPGAATPAPSSTASNTPKLTDNVIILDDTAPAPVMPQATNRPVAATPEHTYTVKQGETLTRIALEQMGTADAVSAIVELNKIKDPNRVVAGTKLRLPAKPISAVAQNQ